MFLLHLDLIIAVGIVVGIASILLITKVGKLPKKTLPFIIGGTLGVIGFTIYREKRLAELHKELKALEDRIKEREKHLKELKEKYNASEEDLIRVRAELQKQEAAYQSAMLKIQKETQEERERIDNLSGEDLHHEFLDTFGNN